VLVTEALHVYDQCIRGRYDTPVVLYTDLAFLESPDLRFELIACPGTLPLRIDTIHNRRDVIIVIETRVAQKQFLEALALLLAAFLAAFLAGVILFAGFVSGRE
jgi:hypothetical protein